MKDLFIPYELQIIAEDLSLKQVLLTDHNGIDYGGILYQQIVNWFRIEKHINIGEYPNKKNFEFYVLSYDKKPAILIRIKKGHYYETFNEAIKEAFKLITQQK
jgi:hypothetical protein